MSSKRGRRNRGNERLSITEFFEDRAIFITGATGFMGKVLLEKLLRSCPGIRRVYVLMRPKKGKTVDERLQEMFALPMFIKVKRGDPASFDKVIALEGDTSEIGLGLSEADAQMLKDDVSVVFHVAASVRFDDKLRNAVLLNLRGTYETVKLALEMRYLECFMHVSTTYCIKYRDEIQERVYPPPADWRSVLRLAETLDEHTLELFVNKIMDYYPNTYTYTKALAEQVVYEHSDRIPAMIFRPSIVISSMVEPLPGWIDNFNGPVALMVASGKGIVRAVYSDASVRSDFIPCDIAVKSMIVSAWNRATALEPFEDFPVYNCAANDVKGITQQELVEIGHHVAQDSPLNDMVWLPGGTITKCKTWYYIQVLLFHVIPAFIIDSLIKLKNYPPINLMRIQRKVFLANLAVEYFLLRQWNFVNKKLIALDSEIFEEDRAAFSYYVPDIDLIDYFRTCAYGGRQYLMKEDSSTLDDARLHYRRMYWVDKTVKSLFLMLLAYMAVKYHVIWFLRTSILSGCDFISSFL